MVYSAGLYCRFSKNIYIFFFYFGNILTISFLSFFSHANFSQPYFDRFTSNLARMCLLACDWKNTRAFLKGTKTRSQLTTAKKHRNIGNFFTPAFRFSLVVTKRLKFFETIFSVMTSRVLYLSENVIVTVQNRSVFSDTWHNGASKRPNLTAILENGSSYGQR